MDPLKELVSHRISWNKHHHYHCQNPIGLLDNVLLIQILSCALRKIFIFRPKISGVLALHLVMSIVFSNKLVWVLTCQPIPIVDKVVFLEACKVSINWILGCIDLIFTQSKVSPIPASVKIWSAWRSPSGDLRLTHRSKTRLSDASRTITESNYPNSFTDNLVEKTSQTFVNMIR